MKWDNLHEVRGMGRHRHGKHLPCFILCWSVSVDWFGSTASCWCVYCGQKLLNVFRASGFSDTTQVDMSLRTVLLCWRNIRAGCSPQQKQECICEAVRAQPSGLTPIPPCHILDTCIHAPRYSQEWKQRQSPGSSSVKEPRAALCGDVLVQRALAVWFTAVHCYSDYPWGPGGLPRLSVFCSFILKLSLEALNKDLLFSFFK